MDAGTIGTHAIIREKLIEFIVMNFLFGDSEHLPADDVSLLQSGVIDSTGILELIEFLELTFGIQVADNETTPENLDGIENLVRYVSRKRVPDHEDP